MSARALLDLLKESGKRDIISFTQHTSLINSMIYMNECCLFDLILYVPSAIFQLCRDGSSWFEPELS